MSFTAEQTKAVKIQNRDRAVSGEEIPYQFQTLTHQQLLILMQIRLHETKSHGG